MHGAAAMTQRSARNKKRETRKLQLEVQPPRSGAQWALVALKWGAIGGLALAAILSATLALLFWIYGRDPKLPKIGKLSDYDPPQVSRVVTKDGAVIGEIYSQRRTFVGFDQIPKPVIHAFISAEDNKFFEHEGIDYVGMVRALLVNIKSGENKQGASTITQQVVKNLLLSREKTFKRKIQEIILARRLENTLSKEEILALYANEIFFGHGRYGVEEAARFYFGKHVRDINVGEAAVLAGLPKGPNLYSPKKPENRERAKQRQIYVLEQMVRNGYLSTAEAQKWIDEPIKVIADPYPLIGSAPEWVELARQEIAQVYGADKVDKIGVEVEVTMDVEIQKLAQDALRRGLREIDKRQHWGHPLKKIKPDKIDLEVASLAHGLPRGGPKAGAVYRAVVRQVDDAANEMVVDLGEWKASVLLGGPGDARYNPDGKKPSERFAPGYVIQVMLPATGPAAIAVAGESRAPKLTQRSVDLARGPEGAVVVIEPATRRVLAVVGGYDTGAAAFNRAVQAKRQAGSTFKPIVFAAAIDGGEFTPASIVNDAPEVFDLWKPENYKKGKFEGPVRLRYALAKSINTVAIRVTYDVGPERVAEIAHALGIESTLPTTLSLALGSGEVTPLELTNAFTTLAAGGRAASPSIVAKVGGKEVARPQPRQAIRPEVAYVVTNMMQSVITEGTGGKAASLGLDIAGKTGTSNDSRDAWFIGFSSGVAVGVWMGFDDFSRPLGSGESGSTSAVPVFIDIMKAIGKKSDHFERPQGVVDASIDKATGLLAPEGAPAGSSYTEVFVAGTVPTEVAPAPGEVDASDYVLDQYEDDGEGQPPPQPEQPAGEP